MRHALFAVWVVCCLAAIVWPGYPLVGNSIEPRVLGVPFSLAWIVGWVLASFVALGAYHLAGGDGRRGGGG